MQTSGFSTITDKGYILLPFRIRKALDLKPRQSVEIRVTKEKTLEIEPMLTLDEVFRFFPTPKKMITRAGIKRERKLAVNLIAENALSEF